MQQTLKMTSPSLPTITVKSEAESKYKADNLSSAKYTSRCSDTPQTISVIKKKFYRNKVQRSLVEALRNTPGITLQLGEMAILVLAMPFKCVVFPPKPRPMSMVFEI